MQVNHFSKLDNAFAFTHQERSRVYRLGPYRIVEQSCLIPYRLRSKKNTKVTFAVHINRVKPYLEPALRPIEDDPSELYLDESDILADFLEVSESISNDNDTKLNVTAENDTHSLLHL